MQKGKSVGEHWWEKYYFKFSYQNYEKVSQRAKSTVYRLNLYSYTHAQNIFLKLISVLCLCMGDK